MTRSAATKMIEKALLKGVMGFLPNRALLRHGLEGLKEIALTFDDGPHTEGTPLVLDILSSYQVRATFFLVGQKAMTYPHLARRIADEGHEMGNHTQSHRILTELTRKEWIEEIEAGEKTLQSLTGRSISYFRPPKGEFSLSILRHLAAKRTTTVLWSVDPKDFATDGEEPLWNKLRKNPLRGGDIILLHDWVPATVTVLPRFIEWIHEQGFRFATVGGML